jgi:hypothetical protein
MARRTKAQIQEEVAKRAEAREKAYFEAQEKAKAGAAEIRPDLPAPDAYVYSYAWRQDPGAPTGEYTLIKNPNPYYIASSNEIIDPATGEKRPATQSMWSGPTTFRAGGAVVTDPNAKNPVTGLTQAQQEAADALASAKANAATLAAQLGAKIDPNTGKIISSTIDPTKAAAWYATQSSGSTGGTGGGGTGGGGTGGKGGGGGSTPTTYTAPDGKIFTDLNSYNAYVAQLAADAKRKTGQSSYDLLFSEFDRYGLGALVAPLQDLIVEGLSPAEFTLRLRGTDAYKKRFAANQQRIAKGLRALSEAEYVGLEDQYQSIMRQYGLPQSYYSRGDMGRQEGFEKFIAGDVSPVELEDRIQTAQNRVTNAPKQVRDALTQFYGAELGNGDILAYVLDPEKALSQIKRKVTAAEIGGGAAIAGLGLGKERAEELGMFGVTGEQARTGYQTIAEFLPTATKLGDIYAKQGLGPYNQAVAESEVFGVTGATDAASKRRKLAQLEAAQFSGQVGAAGGALSRERAGQF